MLFISFKPLSTGKLVAILALLVASFSSFAQTTLYSRKTGNWDDGTAVTGTWSLLGHAGLACGCTPSATSTVIIGAGHTVTYRSATPASTTIAALTVNDTGGGTLTFGNAGAATTLIVTGDVTVNASGVLQAGAAPSGAHTLTVRGEVVNNGTINLNRTNYTLNFNGATAKTLSGTGTTSLLNLTLNTTASANVNINQSITINGVLNFAANGLMVVNTSSNVTLASGATITNAGTARYIRLDETSASGSQLIRANTGNTAQWRMLYPIGTATGGYNPIDLSSATISTNPTNGSTLALKAILNQSVPGQLRRSFRLVVAGNAAATTFTNGNFYYNSSTDVSTGDVQSSYSLIRYTNNAGVTSIVAGTAPGTTFFTASTTALTLGTGTYYLSIGSATTWYSYQEGVWSDWEVWTLDPSGALLNNPLTQSPLPGDNIVILNGFTVTMDVSNLSLSSTTIEGGATLDMSNTTGQTLGVVEGTGLLRMNGVALPSGTYTNFVAADGGTVEYYNTGGTLSASQTTYNNLLLSNTTGSAITFITASNLTVNGNLNITQNGGAGTVTWQINNGSATQRTLSIAGDLEVSASGRIRVGTGNSGATTPHNLTLQGNLTNQGSIRFVDDTDATYSDANYTSGALWTASLRGNAVNVTFQGLTNTSVTCNDQTDFYRLIMNKGTGKQAQLTIYSANTSNFRLFGPRNQANAGTAPNQLSGQALAIHNGTMILTGSIDIPNLTEGNSGAYIIPQNGALWMNSPNITIQVTSNSTTGGGNARMIFLYGTLRISEGTLNLGYSRGLLGAIAGQLIVEGGTVNTWQLRTTNLGTGNNFAYTQTGGTVNVGTTGLAGEDVSNYPRLALPYTTTAFTMSGGTLNVGNPMSAGTSVGGGIMINSSPSNINITGGTINAYVPASATNFIITSNAPFYNLNIIKDGAGTGTAQLAAIAADDGSTINMAAQPLTVLNDLTLTTANGPSLVCNGNNVTVGGDFDIQTGATFTPGTNTLTLNGSANQTWTQNGTITSLNSVVVSAASSATLTLAGANTFPSITNLTLTSGTLNDGGKTLTVTSTITNNATHTGSGAIVVNGPTAIGGTNGTFGNLTIQTNGNVALNGKQTVTGDLRLTNANTTLNIGSYNLVVDGGLYSDATTGETFSATKRILTRGLHNDLGLTRKATNATDLLFPVGTTTYTFTPVTINVTASTVGYITVNPVPRAHSNVTVTLRTVRHYWRVRSAGFSGISNVVHKNYVYSSSPLRDAASTAYRPGRFDAATFTWSYGPTYNATTAPGTTTVPDFNTGSGWTGISTSVIDGEYTAGNVNAFGAVTVYYSRISGDWSASSTWSTVAVGGTAASSTPCNTCPVVIGDGASNNHTVTIDANNIVAGTLFLSFGSVLDCSTFTGLNFGVNTSGTGRLRVASANFPGGDFVNFIGENGGTVEWYGTSYTIPTAGPAPYNLTLNTYNNVEINPASGQTIVLPATTLTVYNDMTVNAAGQVNTNTGGAYTLSILNNVSVLTGTLSLRNGNATTLSIANDLVIDAGATVALQGGGTRTHTLAISGDITNNGTLTFRNGNELVNVTFQGSTDANLTGTNASATTTLNLVTVNKGTSQTPTVTVDVAGTLNLLTNNWLTLQNGTFNFNKAGGTATLTNTATNNYTIPSTARLKVQDGTVNIANINANNSDLILAGTLEVAGGIVNVGQSANNNNNDIEYASAGTPTILVSAGTLYVNGAIRRSTSTIAGALIYNQSGGTTTIGGRNCNVSPNNTRGVFEIDNNTGSSFSLTGTGALNIIRPSGGGSFADIYLNPTSSSVSATSTLTLGLAGTTQTITLNTAPALGNLTVLSNQTVNLQSSPLTTAGTLTIGTTSTLAPSTLDVTIGGDLSISGTYSGGSNTTTFNGTGAQAALLSASSAFQNITVNKPSGTVTLSGTSPTITDLNLLSGVLDVGSLGLTVEGDIRNNSSQIGSGAIVMSGTSTTQHVTSSGGSFTNFTLAGSGATKTVNLSGSLTINGTLTFSSDNRYLSIASNALTLGASASISGASSLRFIRTNGASSDLGVTKVWPTGSSSFTYPVGALNYYTPVAMTLNVSSSGTFTVAPVNGRHPTSNLGSSEQILNYYWVVTQNASLAYTATGSHVYTFPAGLISGSGGTLRAGYLDIADPEGWITSGHNGTATTTTMTYTNGLTGLNKNLPGADNIYHYAVGTVNTLPNPIEPIYSRLSDADVANSAVGGNWNVNTSWTTDASGFGAPLLGIPTSGVPVVILSGARINMNVNARYAFITQINGLLVVGSSKQHNLGYMKGTGTLRVSTNTFPAGVYTNFVASGGGTIEYVAPMTMNSRTLYNNVSFIGSGAMTMTNSDLTLNGSWTIGSGVTVNNSNNRNIVMAGSWTNNGTYNGGTGTVTFNGTSTQNISGSTSLYDMVVNKSAGTVTLTGSGTTSVTNSVTLTSGNVVTSSTHLLSLPAAATINGGSASSYIAGPVRKVMNAGTSVTFPLGSITPARYRPAGIGGTSAADTWTIEYVGKNPTTDGYNNATMNTTNLRKVSEFEYWNISRAGSSSANLTLSYNTGSYLGSNIGNVNNLRVGHWDGTRWDVPGGTVSYSQSGTDVTGTVSVTNVTSFSPFTLASTDFTSPLPVSWLSFDVSWVNNKATLLWKTSMEKNNDHFEIERSEDGVTYYKVGTKDGSGSTNIEHTYQFVDVSAAPSQRHYYRIRQVDYDGQAAYSPIRQLSAIKNLTELANRWGIYPNPAKETETVTLALYDATYATASTQITITNMNGQEAFRAVGAWDTVSALAAGQLGDLKSGVYVITIASGNAIENYRFIKL